VPVDDERPCGAPTGTGPCTNTVTLGAPSTRCAACRTEHRRRKKADYQWTLRVERRAQRIARVRARGRPYYDEAPVGPRALTPS